jgi:hypothetical protein
VPVRRKRHSFPIAIVIAVVVVVAVVLTAVVVLHAALSPAGSNPGANGGNDTTNDTGGTGSSGSTPIGSAITLRAPSETQTRSDNWYNFTVQSAEGGLEMDNLLFQIDAQATGAIVAPGGSWTFTVLGITGYPDATYSFTTGDWTSGAATGVTSSQQFSLDTGTMQLSGQGDVLKIIGAGSYGGTSSVAIP